MRSEIERFVEGMIVTIQTWIAPISYSNRSAAVIAEAIEVDSKPFKSILPFEVKVLQCYMCIAYLVYHLTSTKLRGFDRLSPKVFRYCAPALYLPIYHLFSQCFQQSSLPHEWKIHCITPIFKSGDRTMVSNYRPISLLSIISKVLERIVYNNIIHFLILNLAFCLDDQVCNNY